MNANVTVSVSKQHESTIYTGANQPCLKFCPVATHNDYHYYITFECMDKAGTR